MSYLLYRNLLLLNKNNGHRILLRYINTQQTVYKRKYLLQLPETRIITRNLSSNNNLVEIKKPTAKDGAGGNALFSMIMKSVSFNLNIGKGISSINNSVQQRYVSLKRKIRFYTTAFILSFLIVYAVIDNSIRTVLSAILQDINISIQAQLNTTTTTQDKSTSNNVSK